MKYLRFKNDCTLYVNGKARNFVGGELLTIRECQKIGFNPNPDYIVEIPKNRTYKGFGVRMEIIEFKGE